MLDIESLRIDLNYAISQLKRGCSKRAMDALERIKEGIDGKAKPLVCEACGLTNEQEPTVIQRCCWVACADCHVRGKSTMK